MAEHFIDFAAPPSDVNVVHDFLDRVWGSDETLTEDERMAFELALIELTSNVIEHADPGSGVSCRLLLSVAPDSISVRLSDSGQPGDIRLSERQMPDELSESGRGLALVQRLVDELAYERSGSSNLWTMRKRRGA